MKNLEEKYNSPVWQSYIEDLKEERYKDEKLSEEEEVEEKLRKEITRLTIKEEEEEELLETIREEIKENEKEIEEDKKIFKKVEERLEKVKEEKRIKEENFQRLKERVKMLNELDNELKGIVSDKTRRGIYLRGIKELKEGEDGKEQILNIADKLVAQAKKRANYEKNLFK